MARGINTINGIDYVYEYKSYWNAELHRSEQKRDYIGKVKDGEFVPNRIYRMRMELEALKRQNGLPSECDERPLEEELTELIRKHNEHKAKLAEKKAEKLAKEEPETEPVSEPVAEPEPVAEEIVPEPEPVVEEPVPVVEETPAEPEVKVEETKPEPVHKPRKHVLRVGELDDEEFGPDLFNVQPSVAPVEEEPEEIIVVEEEEEDEDPDLFAFSDDVEKFLDDSELSPVEPVEEPAPAVEEPVVEETPVEVETPAVEETPVDVEAIEPEPVPEEPKKVEKKARKTKKEKKEEDNGQLFLF